MSNTCAVQRITNNAGDPVIFDRVAYLPYLDHLTRKGAAKNFTWIARFQGGEVDLRLKNLATVMIYGASGSVPVEFLGDAGRCRVSVIFHTRHHKTPLQLVPRTRTDRHDLLSAQILARNNQRKCLVIAKACIMARIRQMGWLMPGSDDHMKAIRGATTLADLRSLEAACSQRYWRRYFGTLGMPEASRRDGNDIAGALDALSAFTSPLIVRWLVVHALSPNHGFLHEPTDYDALVYDLMEPVRHWHEQIVYDQVLSDGLDNLTERSTAAFKRSLNDWLEVPSLQVSAKRKFVLYGMVLALRAYLLGEVNHLHLPMDSLVRSKGRPVNAGYQLPGAVSRSR